MKNKQLIALLREKVYVSSKSPILTVDENRKKLLVSLMADLAPYGYRLSQEAISRLTEEDMKNIHKSVLPEIHKQLMPGTKFCPLYPGFPAQVISKSSLELWEDQHFIYDTLNYEEFLEKNVWYTDNEIKEIRDKSPLKTATVLGTLDEDGLLKIFGSILDSGDSLHAETREELKWFLENYPDYKLPEKIPFKETMCVVMSYRKDYSPNDVNDILRYGIYIMGGEPTLEHVSKTVPKNSWVRRGSKSGFIKNPEWRALSASRSERKDILCRLNEIVKKRGINAVIPDAKRFYGTWILLSERIHPGDYAAKYPEANEFFKTLKSKEESKLYRTWYSLLQEKYDRGEDPVEIAKFLSKRPGELVRRFDSLLRRTLPLGREFEIMEIFLDTEGMKNKTLLELRNYYDKRVSGCPRFVSIKGSAKMHQLTTLEPIDAGKVDIIKDFIERKILINVKNSITEKDLDGKVVYLDPEIAKIPVPSGMRDKLFVVPQCTRFDIPEDKNIIRMFIHWVQKSGVPEDLDLHAFLYKNDQEVSNIGWNTRLKHGSLCVHSGDVLNRDGDCAEYVDINISKCRDEGWKYVVMDVHNYKGRPLNSLDNWLGYTFRDAMEDGTQDWTPSNIVFCKKIEVDDSSIAAWIFDLEKRQAILVGVGLEGIPLNSRNRESMMVKYFTTELKFTCYDILVQYYRARGASVISDINENHDEEVLQKDVLLDYTKILQILG